MKQYLLIFLILIGVESLLAQTPTVNSLSATGTTVKWYNAATGGTAYTGSETLVNGQHYYASQTISGVESTSRLDVIATVTTTPTAPVAATHTALQTQIVWNWNTVSGATGYKWNTTNNYATATDMTTIVTKTETGLTCNTSYTRYVWAYNGSCVSSVTMLTQTTSACTTQTFNYTGALQTYTVPAGVTSLTIEAWGAQGGSTSYAGGAGGYATGNLSVTTGDVLYVYVGNQATSTAGGYNGGGQGFLSGRGGGGASDVRKNGTALTDRVIVAGGGGGAAYAGIAGIGGAGGGTTGASGWRSGIQDTGFCGQGGTQSAGGAACIFYGFATAGSLGQGGNGGTSGNDDGTGGGGGYYGGGGGDQGGGGGGSSYTGGVTLGSTSSGVRSGNGQIIITY